MNLHRLSLVFVSAFALAAAHCDPEGEVPPPATAQSVAGNASSAPSSPDDPLQAAPNGSALSEGPAAEGGGAVGRYASAPVPVGEDPDSYDDDDPAALSDFRPALDPYGSWADDPKYGTVWVPARGVVGPEFRPYVSAGHWTYGDDWVWVSDYDWGWAPFHYGRWVEIEGRGWSWIPGRAYRGAWVAWSVDPGYEALGWAPLPPTFLWFGGAPLFWGGTLGPRWTYCHRADVFAPAVGARVIAGPAVGPVASRMHLYVSATARAGAGPSPERLGYAAAQVPRPTGAVQPQLVRAQQFAKPSTAQPLGARPPTSYAARPAVSSVRPPVAGALAPRVGPAAGAARGPRPGVGAGNGGSRFGGGFRGGFHGGGSGGGHHR